MQRLTLSGDGSKACLALDGAGYFVRECQGVPGSVSARNGAFQAWGLVALANPGPVAAVLVGKRRMLES